MEKDSIIEIYTGTLWEAEMVKSLLENAEIESFIKNEMLRSYSFGATPSAGVKVMILSSDFDKAKIVVDEYRKNLYSNES